MKRYSSAPCLEDAGSDIKRTKGTEHYADLNTKEYLQLALNRILELQQEVKDGTYVEETNNGSDPDTPGSEDITKQILTKVFRDLPGISSSLAKTIDREAHWSHRIDALHSKKIQLLGFDTCRRLALDFMKNVAHESRNRSASLGAAELGRFNFPQSRSPHSRDDEILASDLRKRESSKAQEIRARMLKSLDLHLAAKQRDYTVKLMRSNI